MKSICKVLMVQHIEIRVRKVLDASVVSITGLLSGDFLKLVMIAILLATPVAWWIMNKWLQNYNYRMRISPWIFAAAGALAIGIALFNYPMPTQGGSSISLR